MEKCPVCGKEFDPITGRRRKKFCSDNCRQKAWQANKKPAPAEDKKVYPMPDAEIKAKAAEKNKQLEDKKSPPSDAEIKEAAIQNNHKFIKGQIAAIKEEKIPAVRNTPLGRKSWTMEQNKRIQELESKLK